MVWVYDGSMEGFLTLVARSYLTKTVPEKISKYPSKISLFDDLMQIQTEDELVTKLLGTMQQRLDPLFYRRIFHAFLCDDCEVEYKLLFYIRLGLKDPSLLYDISHPIIHAIGSCEKMVLSTLHRMNAFLRFEILQDGTLYAKMEPPRNVLPLMGKHFCKRFSNERFIIHDLKRGLALVYDGRSMQIYPVVEYDIPRHMEDERHYQQLWRCFFHQIAIESRINPSLQKSHAPLKYRLWMTEFMQLV
ncbi:MAG: TIGR03915 family putative DNA repair protein [Campylobacterales bacterium]|nr:TIGR03915 family putative DNA repair protein [Campylobacterales bacterium]